MNHDCNAYCEAPLHCELIWTSREASEGEIAQSLGYFRGLKVSRVTPAPEAPEIGHVPQSQLDPVQIGTAPAGERAYLVWWE